MAEKQGRVFTVSIPIDADKPPRNRPSSPPPRKTTNNEKPLVRQDSKTKEELWLPVAYHAVSAEVQNEIDRMSMADLNENRPRGDSRLRTISFTAGAADTEQTANELVNQMSVHRKQTREFRRHVNTMPEKNGKDIHPLEAAFKTPPLHRRTAETSGPKQSTRQAPGHDVVRDATSDDHLITLQECERRFDTNMTRGLTEEEVLFRRARDGKNVLSPPRTTPVWLAFLKCLIGGFGIVLWIAFVLCILAYQPFGDPPDPYNIILALVLLAVILIQSLFFFIEERHASNLMASFANMLPTFCSVIRDGRLKQVNAIDLVVGDIVQIKAGDKVPADLRLFEVNQGKVEKSGLTGESEPIPLSVTSADPNLYETKNLALFGTSLLEGSAAGMVINTSDRTVMGKIARVASGTSSVSTSLQKEVNYFTGLVGLMALILCIIVIFGYYFGVSPSHQGFLTVSSVITNCIAVVVSLLPEGAPVSLALILKLVAKRMFSVNILVKKLTVLETLGSATLIASDKTGTLTQNRMTLNHLWIANDHKEDLANGGDKRRKKSKFQQRDNFDVQETTSGCYGLENIGKHLSEPALNYLCQMMCLCNKTVFEDEEDENENQPKYRQAAKNNGPRKIVGNPTEGALLNAAEEYLDTRTLREFTPMIREIAFSSRTKYHLTIHKIDDEQLFQNSQDAIRPTEKSGSCSFVIFLKGAPEYVLGMCSKAVVNGTEVNVDPSLVHRIMKANEFLASQGERVLAFAYRKLHSKSYPENYEFDMDDEERWTSDLCFLGLTGIIDPPREGVAESINECHSAHVRVMMVTGDQPMTAVAIARAVNIITHTRVKTVADIEYTVPYSPDDIYEEQQENTCMSKMKYWFKSPPRRYFKDESIVVAGNDIAQLTKKQWDFVLEHREVVFARTTPQQKLQIVKESRKRGDVVAVTGDGVNDAPALKAADLGVAMGICGSDVSKEAANMVLLDDNFVTIVKGIKEGRLLFNNLKKVICYLFPCGSFSEILPVLASVFLGMPMPLSTFLMIVICVGSDMIGSLGMVHELAESDIMHRPPRNARTDRLVNSRTILYAYFYIGIMESAIAFFMYFFTMWYEGGIYPSQIVLTFDKWTNETYLPGISVDRRTELNLVGQSAFFVSLVMCQLWNLLAARTRYQSIFTQKFQPKLFYYMLGEVAVVLCTVYLPVINKYIYTRPVYYYHFLIPLGLGSVILMCDEIRKLLVRKFPKGILAKLAW